MVSRPDLPTCLELFSLKPDQYLQHPILTSPVAILGGWLRLDEIDSSLTLLSIQICNYAATFTLNAPQGHSGADLKHISEGGTAEKSDMETIAESIAFLTDHGRPMRPVVWIKTPPVHHDREFIAHFRDVCNPRVGIGIFKLEEPSSSPEHPTVYDSLSPESHIFSLE